MKRFFMCLLVVLSALTLFGCDFYYMTPQNPVEKPTDDLNHRHEFTYLPTEDGHTKKAVCGCSVEDAAEAHTDGNGDLLCDLCGAALSEEPTEEKKTINTEANFTFFPTEASDLHREELAAAFEAYRAERSMDLQLQGEYEIHSYVTPEISERYDLDLFSASLSQFVFYFVKQGDTLYPITPFSMGTNNSNCISHVGITDINNDGHIEILTAVNAFADRKSSYYCASFLNIIDTNTKHAIHMTDNDDVNYFKENKDGVLCIYNANGVMPVVKDLQNGKLDEKYYEKAKNLYDTPELNTANYSFRQRFTEAACDLFRVEVTVNDGSIQFPYLFATTYTPPAFEVVVKMTYLGEPFSYTSPDGYLDGAVADFVNANGKITREGWGAACVVQKFFISTEQVIERTYDYYESLREVNAEGVYDMVITYELDEIGLKESIVIKDFLTLTRG